MKIANVEVIHAIKIPAGSYLDGAAVSDATWAMPGRHDIDADLMDEMGWAPTGYVEPILIDGAKVTWGSCCSEHAPQ